jgi:transposase
MKTRRYELTDFEWSIIQPLLPHKPRGVARVDDRRVLNGIYWRLRSGSPWADIPERYGPPTICYNQLRRAAHRAANDPAWASGCRDPARRLRERTEDLSIELRYGSAPSRDPSIFNLINGLPCRSVSKPRADRQIYRRPPR